MEEETCTGGLVFVQNSERLVVRTSYGPAVVVIREIAACVFGIAIAGFALYAPRDIGDYISREYDIGDWFSGMTATVAVVIFGIAAVAMTVIYLFDFLNDRREYEMARQSLVFDKKQDLVTLGGRRLFPVSSISWVNANRCWNLLESRRFSLSFSSSTDSGDFELYCLAQDMIKKADAETFGPILADFIGCQFNPDTGYK